MVKLKLKTDQQTPFVNPSKKKQDARFLNLHLYKSANDSNSSRKRSDMIDLPKPAKQEGRLNSMLEGKGNPNDPHSLSYHIKE